jgi:uncharacterized protein (TIRG00374 family)
MRRSVRHIVSLLVVLLVVEYLVLPQIAGARHALRLLGDVRLIDVLAGVALEIAAIAAYAALTRSVLPRRSRPSYARVLRIDLSTLAISHVIPGGSAAGTSIGYRLLTDAGVDGADAGFALAIQGIGSAVVLNVLLWLGLLVSIPAQGFDPIYGTAALVGAVLLGGFAAVVVLLSHGEAKAAKAARAVARRLPFLDEERVHQLVHRLATRLHELAADRRLLVSAVAWAAANWLLDAASLWVFLAAFGHRTGVDELIVAYGLANVLAAIPITPGGLGVIETVLTSSLVGFGTPRGIAILGVISYRLVSFWLPIPIGAASYGTLAVGGKTERGRRREALRQAAEEGVRQADDPRQWADRVGLRPPAITHRTEPPRHDDPH